MSGIRKVVEDTNEQFPTQEQIQKRAHEIYLKRGGQHGQDVNDWLAAEAELKKERESTAFPSAKTKTASVGQRRRALSFER